MISHQGMRAAAQTADAEAESAVLCGRFRRRAMTNDELPIITATGKVMVGNLAIASAGEYVVDGLEFESDTAENAGI